MEKRTITLTLDKAKEWYYSGNADLREIALQAFTEEEIITAHLSGIKSFHDAVKALSLSASDINNILASVRRASKASAAFIKLSIIRKALNSGYSMNPKSGKLYYPYNPILLPVNCYKNSQKEREVAKVRIGNDTFILIGGYTCDCTNEGITAFAKSIGISICDADAAFLGCATEEVASYMGIHFAKEIFEAKYGDILDFEWL